MQISKVKQNELTVLAKNDKECNETPWTLEDYQNSYENSRHNIFVAKIGSEIIGCIVISKALDEAEILQFWIKSSKQKCGYGTILLRQFITMIRGHGITQIFLEVVTHNSVAIRLYSKVGFRQIGIRKNYYCINSQRYDAIVMQVNFYE